MALADSEVVCTVESFVEFMGNRASTLVDVMARRQLQRAQNGVAEQPEKLAQIQIVELLELFVFSVWRGFHWVSVVSPRKVSPCLGFALNP